ncbi:MAG: hypothetical protein LBC68_10405, partial [Prevotellaceae bacterium]|nr:hypothetical protein [Prevotellaceae bacterium]
LWNSDQKEWLRLIEEDKGIFRVGKHEIKKGNTLEQIIKAQEQYEKALKHQQEKAKQLGTMGEKRTTYEWRNGKIIEENIEEFKKQYEKALKNQQETEK